MATFPESTSTEPLRRESGVALFLILVILTLLLGFVGGSMLLLGRVHARAGFETRDRVAAQYLAEGGLNVIRWELGESSDLAGDGIGYYEMATAAGSTAAEATLISPGRYELVAIATVNEVTVSLGETAVLVPAGMPAGALSVVGGAGGVQFLPSSQTNLMIDGGADSPAIALTDPEFHADFAAGIQAGLDDGFIDASDLTGAGLSGIDAIAEGTSAADFSRFHGDIRDHVSTGLLPSATSTTLPSAAAISYGTLASPALRQFPPAQKLAPGQHLTGHGTLIFHRDLVIESGASLTWDGDIFVYGDSATDALLEIGGALQLNGNLVVISDASRDARFLVKTGGSADITGTLTAATAYDTPNTKLEFLLEGGLELRGILTTIASVHQTEFKPGCDALIEGLYQLAMPTVTDALSVQFKVDGSLEMVRDVDAYESALAGMSRIGSDLELGSGGNAPRLCSFGRHFVR